jgi:AcrR family transcriptional regulator
VTFTRKGLATRQRIIDGAAEYLRSDEPGEMTLDDVRAVTRTTKGQIYRYFPGGKEDLLLEVAKYESERVLDEQQPHLGRLDSWEAWDAWRIALIARYRAQGRQCPLGSLLNQVGTVAGSAEVVTTLLKRWQVFIERGIASMQEQGEVRHDLDVEKMAAAFIVGIQGGVNVLRVTGETTHLESMLDILIEHLRERERAAAPLPGKPAVR